jgi:hypothetical protein
MWLSVRGSPPPDPGDRGDLSNTFGQLSYLDLTPSRFLLLLSRIGERNSDGNIGAIIRGLDITPFQIPARRTRGAKSRFGEHGVAAEDARRPAWPRLPRWRKSLSSRGNLVRGNHPIEPIPAGIVNGRCVGHQHAFPRTRTERPVSVQSRDLRRGSG